MPHNPLGKWLGADRDLYIRGYFGNRIAKGDFPDDREPRTSLPKIPAGTSMRVETGFLAALRAEEQKSFRRNEA